MGCRLPRRVSQTSLEPDLRLSRSLLDSLLPSNPLLSVDWLRSVAGLCLSLCGVSLLLDDYLVCPSPVWENSTHVHSFLGTHGKAFRMFVITPFWISVLPVACGHLWGLWNQACCSRVVGRRTPGFLTLRMHFEQDFSNQNIAQMNRFILVIFFLLFSFYLLLPSPSASPTTPHRISHCSDHFLLCFSLLCHFHLTLWTS